jgi:hypothetical protein
MSQVVPAAPRRGGSKLPEESIAVAMSRIGGSMLDCMDYKTLCELLNKIDTRQHHVVFVCTGVPGPLPFEDIQVPPRRSFVGRRLPEVRTCSICPVYCGIL